MLFKCGQDARKDTERRAVNQTRPLRRWEGMRQPQGEEAAALEEEDLLPRNMRRRAE